MTTPLALIYSRVSTEDQAREGISLAAQVAACRKYIVGHGWVLGREYQDVMSGLKDQRPSYQELLADVRRLRKEGQPVVVTVAALDRFGRKVLERVRAQEEFTKLDVTLHSIREGGAVPPMMATIMAAVAQEESERTSQRIKSARGHISALGWAPVGRLPWGYVWRDATADERAIGAPARVLDINETEAPYVRELFQRVADGASIRQAAQWVRELPEAVRGGRVLDYTGVRTVLYSPTVIARSPVKDGGDALEGRVMRWPAIVSDELWRAAHRSLGKGRQLGRQASGDFLLSGIARCPRCGSRMAGRMRAVANQKRYRCNDLQSGRCNVEVPTHLVDGPVLAQVAQVIERATAGEFRAVLRQAWDRLRAPAVKDDTGKRIAALERDAERARKRLADAATLLVDGDLDRAGYDAMRDQVQAEQAAIQGELARLRGAARQAPTLPPFEQVMTELASWSDVLAGLDTRAQRDVISELIDQVTPEPTGRRGKYRMRIVWTPVGDALRRLGNAVRKDGGD